MSATADQELAELRRAYEDMRSERDSALAALARRNTEYGERIEHQAATIDVLKVMSASPGDPQPVFDLIARQAAKLCNVPAVAVATFDGTLLHLAAQSGFDPAYADAYVARFPRPVGTDSSMGRAILNRRIDQVEDIAADPTHSFGDVLGHWSVIAVPLLREGMALGAIALGRPAMGPFSDSQVALLQTFAEQAVIAISSAETYRALQGRTADLQESLEYQTATSDVLKVISRSAFDLQPVLRMTAETAVRLCAADQAAIARYHDGWLQLAANFGFPPEYQALLNESGGVPIEHDSPMVTGRAVIERRVVHELDVAAIPGYPRASIELGRQRTSLAVPLLREGEPIGAIILARQRVKPFTERQIELVTTFADQAVIAIENTRLLAQLQEALEQQTATSEVLQVINASPGDLAPVFEAILEKAHILCSTACGSLELIDRDRIYAVAVRGFSDSFAEVLRNGDLAAHQPATRPLLHGEQYNHIIDVSQIDHPTFRGAAQEGLGTVLFTPLRKDEALLGMIASARREVRPSPTRKLLSWRASLLRR